MNIIKKITLIFKKYKEALSYLFYGVLTTLVNWGVFQVLNDTFSVNWEYANVIAWIAAVVFAYITNRKYVFKSISPNIIREFLFFTQLRFLSLLLDMLAMYILIEMITITPFMSKVITGILVLILNYIFSKKIIFKDRRKKDGLH